MRVSSAEVAKTIGYLDAIYGGLMPKGGGKELVSAWQIALKNLDIEPGDLFFAAELWVQREDSQFAPKPGQLISIIRDEQTRREHRKVHDAWMRSGGLIRTGGVLVNRDGDECDEQGRPLPQLTEGKPRDADLDDLVRRITKQVRKGKK